MDRRAPPRAAPARRPGARPRAGRGCPSTRRRGAGSPRARTVHPAPGGSAWRHRRARRRRRVARSRVSSSRRHVGMLATASAPSSRNSSRSGAASASSVSAVTDGSPAVDLDRDGLEPVDVRRPRPRPARGDRPPTRRPRPRFCHGSPATTSSTRSRPSARARVGRRDDVADVDRVEGATEDPDPLDPATSTECTAASEPRVHSRRRHTCRNTAVLVALALVTESSVAHVLVRVWLPDRPGALGLVASRIGCGAAATSSASTCSSAARASPSTSSPSTLADLEPARAPRPRDRAGRRRVGRGGPHRRRASPTPASTRSSPRPTLCEARRRSTSCSDALVDHDPARVPRRLDRARARRRARSPTAGDAPAAPSSSTRSPPARRRRRTSPTARPAPTTSRSPRSPATSAMLLVGRERPSVPPPGTGPAPRARPRIADRPGRCSTGAEASAVSPRRWW